ncbi:hypothetical protein HMPREF1544_11548 [Mucor circinelloides 1006PhL]|uniref:Uncharacterized protein n=1 Tax=Mucor circinelloides f. circinelloides (strain 1006PhL) TaxID=1220926 RepID=S2IWR0_MUCC1|nr:hypothetical protein HMPREF1544_11548 [Mucor circinelloides 1006PhL]
MSKRPVSAIIKDWHKKSIRQDRKTPSQIRKLIQQDPNSFEARLHTSPYASILASPLRKCSFHSRIFPSKLLLRFGLAWHPETNRNWAFPTLRKASGFGYYVSFKKEILQILQKGAYQAIFRGAATYRSDMVEHVQDVLFQQTYTEFCKHPIQMHGHLRVGSSNTVAKAGALLQRAPNMVSGEHQPLEITVKYTQRRITDFRCA